MRQRCRRHEAPCAIFSLTVRPLRWLVPGWRSCRGRLRDGASVAITATADRTLPAAHAPRSCWSTCRTPGSTGCPAPSSSGPTSGLPELPGVGGADSSELDARWSPAPTPCGSGTPAPDKARLALLGTLGETDVIRNGTDVWSGPARTKPATHRTAARRASPAGARPAAAGRRCRTTPQEAAEQALAAIDPTTTVTTDGAATVAGRAAYELVLEPSDPASLVGQVRLAIDGETHVPLRVQVFAADATSRRSRSASLRSASPGRTTASSPSTRRRAPR